MEEEKEVQAEEMSEQETNDFEEAFSEAEAGEETGQDAEEGAGAETEEEPGEEAPAEEKPEGPAKGEEEKAAPVFMIGGREYTQEEIAQKLAEAEKPRSYSVLEQLAKDAGKTVDEYLADVETRYEESQIDVRAKERAEQLIGQGMEENFAEHLARVEVENANFKAKAERSKQQAMERGQRAEETRAQADARMKAEIAEFNSVYPDVREIPPEVLDEISKTGHSPVVAYQNYLLQKQENELKALKQARKNKESTPGPAKGTQAGKKDEFSEAFMGVFNE